LLSAHLVHDPPQSVSVSVPFFAPSEHVGTAHLYVAVGHTELWQSRGNRQLLAFAQGEQVGPPQSTSVSLPFLVVSLQPAP
jgi:hypothetical protein